MQHNFLIRFFYCSFLPVILLTSLTSFSQVQNNVFDEIYETEPYDIRIKKSYLNGVYIPKDLEDAISELDKKTDTVAKAAFKKYSEEEAGSKAYFSFGRWMMLKWGMEEGSRLSHYFAEQNLGVVEDMVRVLMISYHRHLHNRPLDTENLMQQFISIRQKEAESRKQRIKRDTVPKKGG